MAEYPSEAFYVNKNEEKIKKIINDFYYCWQVTTMI